MTVYILHTLYQVWALVDLYGQCSRVSLVDCENRHSTSSPTTPLLFHSRCGDHAQILDGGTVAGRKRYCLQAKVIFSVHIILIDSAFKLFSLLSLFLSPPPLPLPSPESDFNHSVVLSNRPLISGELFEVEISAMQEKWSGSIELGVTTHK